MIRWFLAMTFWGAEAQVERGALAIGAYAFLPERIDLARYGRWHRKYLRAQFPGYLFLGIEIGTHSLDDLRAIIGMRKIVEDNNGRVIWIPDRRMRQYRAKALRDLRESRPKRFAIELVEVGAAVTIPSGPFAGMPGFVDKIDKHGFCDVSIGHFGRSRFSRKELAATVRESAAPARNSERARA